MFKRLFLIFISILILSSSVFCNDWHKVRLLKISDGDTFIVYDNRKKIKLRLIYIDTPEKFSSRKLSKDCTRCNISRRRMRQLGYQSTNYAKRFFKGKKYIYVKYYGKGYYGRVLAEVGKAIENKIVIYNLAAVLDGYSCLYTNSRYPKEYKDALNSAKKNKKGLWYSNYREMLCLCDNIRYHRKSRINNHLFNMIRSFNYFK